MTTSNTTATPTTTPSTASIFIAAGTIVGYSFSASGKTPITGTVALLADAYIDNARRDEDGSWSYDLAPGRTYYCAGGLAEVLPTSAAVAAGEISQ